MPAGDGDIYLARPQRHCRMACEEHGHWCVIDGAEHATHETELCGCVWTGSIEENSNDEQQPPDPTGA